VMRKQLGQASSMSFFFFFFFGHLSSTLDIESSHSTWLPFWVFKTNFKSFERINLLSRWSKSQYHPM
jgi:hypothetical protein